MFFDRVLCFLNVVFKIFCVFKKRKWSKNLILLSESQIILNRNPTPLGTFTMLFLGKQVLEITYEKVLVVLAIMPTEIRLNSLSNVRLRSRNSKTSSATSLVN